jgi:hypothetical protein
MAAPLVHEVFEPSEKALDHLVRSCLEEDPDERIQTI